MTKESEKIATSSAKSKSTTLTLPSVALHWHLVHVSNENGARILTCLTPEFTGKKVNMFSIYRLAINPIILAILNAMS